MIAHMKDKRYYCIMKQFIHPWAWNIFSRLNRTWNCLRRNFGCPHSVSCVKSARLVLWVCNSFHSGHCNLECLAHSLAFIGYHYILKAFMWYYASPCTFWVSFHIFPFTLLCLEVKISCSRITGSQCTNSYVSGTAIELRPVREWSLGQR